MSKSIKLAVGVMMIVAVTGCTSTGKAISQAQSDTNTANAAAASAATSAGQLTVSVAQTSALLNQQEANDQAYADSISALSSKSWAELQKKLIKRIDEIKAELKPTIIAMASTPTS